MKIKEVHGISENSRKLKEIKGRKEGKKGGARKEAKGRVTSKVDGEENEERKR
jgi:hypothetical protein